MEPSWATGLTALGGKGWANAVEDEEEERGAPLVAPAALQTEDNGGFPTLGASMAGGGKKKKAKPQKVSIGDFNSQNGTFANRHARPSDEISKLNLPRFAQGEEAGGDDRYGDRGGFRRDGGGGFGDRQDRGGDEGGWEPSKADMSGDWGADRRSMPMAQPEQRRGGFGGRDGDRESGGGFGGGGGGGFGRADEEQEWSRGSNFKPAAGGGFGDRGDRDDRRQGGFGGGGMGRSDDQGQWERGSQMQSRGGDDGGRGGYQDNQFAASKADETDNWAREKPSRPIEQQRPASHAADSEDRWARKSTTQDSVASDRGTYNGEPSRPSQADGPDKWARPGPTASDIPASRAPGERPRLKLAPRTKPLPDQISNVTETSEAKSSIFGAARPRETVLKEQGRDYKEEEAAMEVKELFRKTTKDERTLADAIESLRVRIEAGEADVDVEVPEKENEDDESADQLTVQKLLDRKEMELSALSARLDEEAKYKKSEPKKETKKEKETPATGWKSKVSTDVRVSDAAEAAAAAAVDTDVPTGSPEPVDSASADDGGFQEVASRSGNRKSDRATPKSDRGIDRTSSKDHKQGSKDPVKSVSEDKPRW